MFLYICYTCLPFFSQQNKQQKPDQQELEQEYQHQHQQENEQSNEYGYEHEDEDEREHEALLQHNLSRWDLFLSWSQQQLSRLRNKSRQADVQDDSSTEILPEIGRDDQVILDDMASSFLESRRVHRLRTSKNDGQELIPTPTHNYTPINKNQMKVSSTRSSRLKQNTRRTKSSIKSPNRFSLPSLISDTTESIATSSLPSLPAATDSSLCLSSTSTSTSSQLDSESIRFIHQSYNHRCRKLFGHDLSRAQIHQIHQHLTTLVNN